ncbi:LuxR C-terminal-related transcriptional regulator [Mycolicibacterium fortuitum]|uniref:LuxR C-terminal-related transcriptional regulator n=1 Tax=Mycolicibacterium fortuitum TaxID=1766 RepID=UPI003AAB5C1A
MTACLDHTHPTTCRRHTRAASSIRPPVDVVPAASRSTTRVQLSARELEILVTWLKTDSKTAVGEELFLAPSTVRTYLQRIREKYAHAGRPARTKAALVARAIQDGYIGLDEL